MQFMNVPKYERKPHEFCFENAGIYAEPRQSNRVAVHAESRNSELVRRDDGVWMLLCRVLVRTPNVTAEPNIF